MAGDPLRDAFRTRLATHVATAPATTRSVQDTVNTTTNPDATAPGWIDLEFPGGSEEQYSFGSPGSNWWREYGQVTVRIVTPIGGARDSAEVDAALIRSRFRNDSFSAGSATVRITETAPMGGGQDDGGMWVETVALGYRIYNVG